MADAPSDSTLTRREFAEASIKALLAGMAVTLAACSGGPAYVPGAPSPTASSLPAQTSDKAGEISGNHGHAARITGAQLDSGGSVSLNLLGWAGHDHSLELTADDVVQVAAGGRVTKISSIGIAGAATGAHSHGVRFN